MSPIPVIVIYHHPQECGSPYLTFISQQTGQVLEQVDIPAYDYYTAGQQRITTEIPVRTFTEQVCQTPKPTLSNVRIKAYCLSHPRDHKFKPIKVTITGSDDSFFRTWTADITVQEYIEKTDYRYSSSLDTFKQQMTSLGFDMKGWCLYKRQRTSFTDFLKAVCSSFRNYHLINLIQIY